MVYLLELVPIELLDLEGVQFGDSRGQLSWWKRDEEGVHSRCEWM